eukprot:5535372-Pyramimonas_sp.AAC.1
MEICVSLEREHHFLVGSDWDLGPSLVDSRTPEALGRCTFGSRAARMCLADSRGRHRFLLASTSMARAVESKDAV